MLASIIILTSLGFSLGLTPAEQALVTQVQQGDLEAAQQLSLAICELSDDEILEKAPKLATLLNGSENDAVILCKKTLHSCFVVAKESRYETKSTDEDGQEENISSEAIRNYVRAINSGDSYSAERLSRFVCGLKGENQIRIAENILEDLKNTNNPSARFSIKKIYFCYSKSVNSLKNDKKLANSNRKSFNTAQASNIGNSTKVKLLQKSGFYYGVGGSLITGGSLLCGLTVVSALASNVAISSMGQNVSTYAPQMAIGAAIPLLVGAGAIGGGLFMTSAADDNIESIFGGQ